MRRPTILFINRVYPPGRGATGRLLHDLARAFARRGWNVTVVTSGDEVGDVYERGIRVIRVNGPEKPKGVREYMRVWVKLFFAAMKVGRRDVVVSMSDPPLFVFAGYLVAKFLRAYHINWCHDLYPEVLPSLGIKFSEFWMKFFRYFRCRAMNYSDKVIVNGRCMARYLTHEGGVNAQKVAVVPNWPDMELINPEAAENNIDEKCFVFDAALSSSLRSFDKQLKSKQRFRILYAGSIGLVHPVDSILEAAEIFDKEGSDIEFVFIGDGPGFDEIARFRSKSGVDNIRFIPFQPIYRLRKVMESGDVHLISMKEEAAGFVVPSKLYSALAVARPCIFIGPEQCECAKVIRDYRAGVVLPQGNARILVKAIKVFRESEEAWFGAYNGTLRAGEVYTPYNSIEAIMKRAEEFT